jgi:hypothetical protein
VASAPRVHRRVQGQRRALALDEGKTVSAAARDLDLTETPLREWVKRARADRTHERTGLTTVEREELTRLRKEVRILAEEREIIRNGHAYDRTRVGMKVIASVTRASRAKVDAYWCPEPGKKWARVPRLRHPVLLPESRKDSGARQGNSHSVALPGASRRREVRDGGAACPLLRDRCPQGIAGGVPSAAAGAPEARRGAVFCNTTAEILRLHAWLSAAACTHVAMESTGVYWQPVFNLLEGSFAVVLANAHHIKAVPGRKTDVKDCEWLADLLAHGLIRASFIPPVAIRALRDLTPHRKSLIRDRVTAVNRVHKLLEGANIKLGNVVSDVLGVSGRAMLDALVAGERDPTRLASLARGSLTSWVKSQDTDDDQSTQLTCPQSDHPLKRFVYILRASPSPRSTTWASGRSSPRT